MKTRDNDFYTETLALLYREQGYPEKALECYEAVLDSHPEFMHIIPFIEEIKSELHGDKDIDMNNKDILIPLFGEWLQLIYSLRN